MSLQFHNAFLAVFVGLASIVWASDGQVKVDVEVRDSIHDVVAYNWMDTQTPEVIAKLRAASLISNVMPAAAAALHQNEALMAELFRPKKSDLEALETETIKGRDILLAKWKPTRDSAAVKMIAVWDDPDFDLFLFETDPAVLGSADKIRSFWSSLFVFPNTRLQLVRIQFKLARQAQVGTVGVGWTDYFGGPASIAPGNDPRGYGLYVGAYRTNDRAYMCVWAGKRLFPYFDRDTAFIPERFPPLRERLKSATTASLLDQLAGPQPRVFLVANELVSRKLSPEDFGKTLTVSVKQLPDRLSLLFAAMNETHTVVQYKSQIDALVHKYSQVSDYNPTILGAVLSGFRGTKELDLSQTALDLIARGDDVPLAISYLEFSSNKKEIAQKLRALKVPENMERMKEIAVNQILLRAETEKEERK